MKDVLKELDKAFENRIRLGIMSALIVNDYMDFNSLKTLLDVTDGNLASHLKTLEKCHYIQYTKVFIERKSNTCYAATPDGIAAFRKHLNAIEQLLK